MKKTEPLFTEEQDWTFPLLKRTYEEIEKIAVNDFKLDCYPNQIEIIDSEQMLESYTSVGMPNYYRHWSFGKSFESQKKQYTEGYTSLAYELVLNSNPCIAYLQENNTMTMQALVIAHACFGHNAVFKGNEMFTTWTQAGSIMDYLSFARSYIGKCEELYGEQEVESILDSCHALQYHGVNTYKNKTVSRNIREKIALEEESFPEFVNPRFDRILDREVKPKREENRMTIPKTNKDNLLYFIEKHSPVLPEWKREIVRIVRTISQYFYPQMMTKVLNEGFASYTHYKIMEKMHENGVITDSSWMEFILSHTNVVAQSGVSYGKFRGWNPYALGYAIFNDIERICKKPTDEDKEWFPELIGQNYVEATQYAMKNFSDTGFIAQYLSPKVIRDFKMFSIYDPSSSKDNYEVSNVSDSMGYGKLRELLSRQYERNYMIPYIEVVGANLHDDRTLVLKYFPIRNRELNDSGKNKMLEHLKNIWGYEVKFDNK
jgi:spore cortex formation protein SpoVR/YcgB (stage V sporulation)